MALTGECKAVRFMNNNLCCSAVLSASSAETGFPVENLKDENRTKFWRASGHFEITTANHELYINDGGDKTVSITTGQYLTGTALASQIEADLNATSSGWSVGYSTTTYKFTISRASGTLRLSSTTDAIWDTLGYVGAVDIVLSGGQVADEIRIHTSEYIDVEAGHTAWEVTFIGLLTEIGSVMSMSDSATIKIQANSVQDFTAPPFEETIAVNDQGYLKFVDATTNYKYWRISITDRTNANGPAAVSASYLYVGDYLTFTGTNVARGFSKEIIDPSSIQETQSGRRYFNRRRRYERLDGLTIQLPSRADRLAFEQFVYDFGLTYPFFISLDPGNKISDDLVELTKFVYFDSLPTFDHAFLDLYNIQSFSVREVV